PQHPSVRARVRPRWSVHPARTGHRRLFLLLGNLTHERLGRKQQRRNRRRVLKRRPHDLGSGSKCDLDRVGQLIDATQDGLPRLLPVNDLFSHDVYLLTLFLFGFVLDGDWFFAEWLSITASTSSSFMMRYSSPSSLISWPAYLPNRIRLPDR